MESLANLPVNQLIEKEIACDCGKTHKINAKIFYADFKDGIGKILSVIAPYGKVACVSTNDGFISLGKELITYVESQGGKLINVVLQKRFDNTIENISSLFCLPEDIRCVIVLGTELQGVAEYLAHVRNIPVVIVPLGITLANAFADMVNVNVKGKEIAFRLKTEKILLIDKKLISKCEESQVANAFAEIVSKTVAIFDYKIKDIVLKDGFCRESYNLAREVIKDVLNVLVIKEKDRKTFLLDKQIKLSIADNYAGGIFSESAERLVSSLLQSKANKDIDISQVRLAVSQKLFEFYRLFLGHNGKDITKTPDYNYRAEILSKLTSLSELEIIKGFTKFSDEEIKTALEGQKMSLYAEIDGMCRLSKSINDINVALGGDTNVLDNFAPIDVGYAIYSASDFPNTFSLLTLIRDIGMLEYIG